MSSSTFHSTHTWSDLGSPVVSVHQDSVSLSEPGFCFEHGHGYGFHFKVKDMHIVALILHRLEEMEMDQKEALRVAEATDAT